MGQEADYQERHQRAFAGQERGEDSEGLAGQGDGDEPGQRRESGQDTGLTGAQNGGGWTVTRLPLIWALRLENGG